jgi:glycosyltransferase involved in cell wall biosynthesis
VAPSDIQRYYSGADIYVQAPSIDNMPLSVLEAFASGMPVVSTDVGGVSSLLRHGTDGLLVADNDDAAMAAQVSKLLADPLFARGLAGSAHHTLAAYEWPVVGEAWLRTYRHAAGHRREQPAAQPATTAPSNPT